MTIKFKPVYGGSYFYVFVLGNPIVYGCIWNGDPTDMARFKSGNCFATKAEATKVLKEIKKILKENV